MHHPGPPWRFLTLQTVQRWTRPSLVLRTNQTSPCCALLARIHPAQHCSATAPPRCTCRGHSLVSLRSDNNGHRPTSTRPFYYSTVCR